MKSKDSEKSLNQLNNLICVFNGLGKTTLAAKYADIYDLDELAFIQEDNQAEFVSTAKRLCESNRLVLASAASWVLAECARLDIKPLVFLPETTRSAKKTILARIKARDIDFYNKFVNYYDAAYSAAVSVANFFGLKIIYIPKDKYLEDVLKELSIIQ